MIEPARTADLPALADVLARAFRDNPGLAGILSGDSPERRVGVLQGCMLGFARSVLRYGAIELVRRDGVPVATTLAFEPGRFPLPPLGQLMTAAGVLRHRPGRAWRFLVADQEMHRRHLREPHWYLWFLGVTPAQQRQGLGSELLRALLAKADASGQPCFLETDTEQNMLMYQRHGFEVVDDAVLKGMNARMWFMLRPVPKPVVLTAVAR